MKHFKKVTTTPPSPEKVNAVVMGRATWESLPKALPGRTNVVLTRSLDYVVPEGVLKAGSLQDAADQLEKLSTLGHVFCIGGGAVYNEAIQEGFVNRIIYTEVSNLPEDQKFDTYFPELHTDEWESKQYGEDKENGDNTQPSDGPTIQIWEYTRLHNAEEMQYLELCREILESGIQRGDRTGTGTLSKFGAQMRFDLRNGKLPLLTTKRTFWRGVAEELLWLISVRMNGCCACFCMNQTNRLANLMGCFFFSSTTGQYERQCSGRKGYSHLGRKWFQGVFGISRTRTQRGRRLGPSLWFSMASFWGQICGYAHGLHWPRRRSISGMHSQNQRESRRSSNCHVGLESG